MGHVISQHKSSLDRTVVFDMADVGRDKVCHIQRFDLTPL
jgi:hypothetical protein